MRPRGLLMAIGGAEDKLRERVVLRHFVERSGGASAQLAVVPAASTIPAQVGESYRKIFRELGVSAVEIVPVDAREQAQDPGLSAVITQSTGIFLSGGNQLRLMSLLGGTPIATAIRRASAAGTVVAGTSAGAAALCQHMIATGHSGYAPSRRLVRLSPGLGLVNRVVVDQHFSQRHRIGRLFTAVTLNPFLVGVGIDEDTAVLIDAEKRLGVVGRGTVTIVDGSQLVYTDIYAVTETQPVAVLGMAMHMLTAGCRFDLVDRRAEGPATLVSSELQAESFAAGALREDGSGEPRPEREPDKGNGSTNH